MKPNLLLVFLPFTSALVGHRYNSDFRFYNFNTTFLVPKPKDHLLALVINRVGPNIGHN